MKMAPYKLEMAPCTSPPTPSKSAPRKDDLKKYNNDYNSSPLRRTAAERRHLLAARKRPALWDSDEKNEKELGQKERTPAPWLKEPAPRKMTGEKCQCMN